MEALDLAKLLEYGIHGVLIIVLLVNWYERREMRGYQLELLKLFISAHPEVTHLVAPDVKAVMEKRAKNGE